MSDEFVKITVDGQQIEARKGAMLIEATDAVGIKVPRFCYHEKLSIAANCRMCLVEVEKAPKPLPACATPIMDGMVVHTASEQALDAQQGTMEFLLINHPLDCPICDQGGECELQDVAMGYGAGVSRFSERKRAVEDKDIGPLVATGMTRCIHCTRCIRFGDEIAGVPELGATGRGEDLEIGTYVSKAMTSELSGNVIDVCPVGALMAKPSYNQGRSWEYLQHATLSPHDTVGSNLYLHTIRGKIMRAVPRDNDDVNEIWLSDRDRFSYQGIYADDRALRPLLKDGASSDWEAALAAAHDGLQAVIAAHGADAVGVLLSPQATLEELYLAQKLARGLGINNIDHRLRQADFRDDATAPLFPWLGQSLNELEQLNAALVIGGNPRLDQPLLCHRLRKAALAGGQLFFINPYDYDQHFPVAGKTICAPQNLVAALAAVARAATESSDAAPSIPANLAGLIDAAEVDDNARQIATALSDGKLATVLLGEFANGHPDAARLRALAATIAAATGAALGYLPAGANGAGAWLAGALPHRLAGGKTATAASGLNAAAMIAEPRRAYVLVGSEPEIDCYNGPAALAALQQADFVVSLSPYASAAMRDYADVILPTATFAETSGSYVNNEGRWQSFSGACTPLGEARPAWKVLRVLGNLFQLDGFDYVDSSEVKAEVEAVCDLTPDNTTIFDGDLDDGLLQQDSSSLIGVAELPIYSADPLVRRAPALQQTPLAEAGQRRARINPAQWSSLGLSDSNASVQVSSNGTSVVLPLVADDAVPPGSVWLPQGGPHEAAQFARIATVTISKA